MLWINMLLYQSKDLQDLGSLWDYGDIGYQFEQLQCSGDQQVANKRRIAS